MRASLLVLAGCGRLGFADQPPDADATSFDVESGACLTGSTGPFVEVARFPTTGGGYGVWAAPPYVLMADTTGGLHALRFDGAAFTEVDHYDFGWVEDVWQAAGTTFVASPGTGLSALALGGDGSLTVLAQDTVHAEARRGWESQGILYLPTGGSGLFALRWTGTAFDEVGALASMGWGQGAWASGTRAVFADNAALRLVDFDGSALVDAAAPLTAHDGATRVWSKDGETVFVASGDGVTAYRRSGAQLVEVATFTTDGAARDVWSDGAHVFAAAEHGGIYALAFDGAAFTQVSQTDVGHTGLGVIGDGTYIFANDLDTGLHAYTGFACTQR